MARAALRRPSRKSSSQGHAIAELSNAILQFGVNLYRALRSGSATAASDTLPVHDHLENVLLSPYLIASMMQPMAAGARGETAAQIFRLVQCPEVAGVDGPDIGDQVVLVAVGERAGLHGDGKGTQNAVLRFLLSNHAPCSFASVPKNFSMLC